MSKCLPFFQKKSLATKFKDFFQNIGLQKCNKNAQGGHFWQILMPENYPEITRKLPGPGFENKNLPGPGPDSEVWYPDSTRTRLFWTRSHSSDRP